MERYPFQNDYHSCGNYNNQGQTDQNKFFYISEHGLQEYGTRHNFIGELARNNYYNNIEKEKAKEIIKNFLKENHNGKSKEINKNNWKLVNLEIDTWVDQTYKFFNKKNISQNQKIRIKGWITTDDLFFILEKFYGNYILMKKAFRFISFYRGLTNGELLWIKMSKVINRKIFGSNYNKIIKEFIDLIFVRDNKYIPNLLPKKVKLLLDKANPNDRLKDDNGYAIQDLITALFSTFGSSTFASKASGISRRNFYKGDKDDKKKIKI